MTPGTRSPDATPEAVRAAACVRVRLIPALGLVTVECSFLFERLGPVNPFRLPWRDAHFSFGAVAHHLGWKLSRLLNSRAGRQAARKQLELAGTGSGRGRLGLKGSSRLSTCQQAINSLRATAALAGFALPVRAFTSV
jgi:hypothetical protein